MNPSTKTSNLKFVLLAAGFGALVALIVGEDPAWSPDGGWIAFASRRDAPHLQIYITQRDGSAITRLTNSRGDDWAPGWGR